MRKVYGCRNRASQLTGSNVSARRPHFGSALECQQLSPNNAERSTIKGGRHKEAELAHRASMFYNVYVEVVRTYILPLSFGDANIDAQITN